eukprot:CAMPEP_0113947832 /NCGR_PEP_ID=MMETSP1339-20121228/66916_1 /TAXON_ID=94617 /ORGANISM="Fibrocapsa japonica" /LENGTH=280 /DNA_ID=CAMNT_0000954587 /DNA_START=205 /DNA_END=1047 /DNA_ORIENTATION=- /assembly_acc=CAM_ASM_000762
MWQREKQREDDASRIVMAESLPPNSVDKGLPQQQEHPQKVYQAWQYYGKWPFVRVLGCQEIASVLFSLGNAAPHALFLLSGSRRAQYSPPGYYLSPWLRLLSICSLGGWACSAVFHARDVPVTEKMDYFSAALMICINMWTALLRCFGPFRRHPYLLSLAAVTLGALYSAHVYYMSFVLFDYGYNMKASITMAIISTALWMYWAASSKRRHCWKLIVSMVIGHCLLALELYDFAPIWGLFDAHAIWHASTIPLGFMWYSFTVDDARFEMTVSKDKYSKVI